MVAVFDAGVPARRIAISDAGGEFQLSLTLPFAVKPFAFLGSAKVARPDEAVIEEVLVQDDLALELAFLRPIGRFDIQGQPDRVLVRAQESINPLVRDRLEKAAFVASIGIDAVRHERAGTGGVVRAVAEGVHAVVVQVQRRLQVVANAVLELGAELPRVEVATRLPMTLGDPLLDLALTLRMSIGGVDIAERRVASGRRLA